MRDTLQNFACGLFWLSKETLGTGEHFLKKNVGTNNIPVHTLKDNRLPNLETLQHFPKLETFLHGALKTYIFF